MGKKALIIFIRKPELGKVKTRLAAQVGAESALDIYKRLLDHTRVIASAAACDKYIFVTEPLQITDWKSFMEEIQISGSLGEKMQHAFLLLFKKGYQKMVIIGSDCPHLQTTHIEKAFELLAHNDLVAGPANDGGYYLLGLKKIYPALFENKPWSTGLVMEETIATAMKLGLSYKLLETLTDVDEEKDLPLSWR
ncbi:MAG: TIGR04282 family arsenosugar biosynthesis glycosyltransferase [Ferruginibacter sp.]